MDAGKLQLAQQWFLLDILKFGLFKLKNGRTSRYYIDFGPLRSNSDTTYSLVEFIKYNDNFNLKYDLIADVPTRITPFVSVLSCSTNIPMITPRIDKKEYGSGKKIDGIYQKGQEVLLVDDVITTSKSKFEAIEILESEGLKVNTVLVMVDREQGGKQELEARGYNLISVFTISELMNALLELDLISTEQFTNFKNDQIGWSKL